MIVWRGKGGVFYEIRADGASHPLIECAIDPRSVRHPGLMMDRLTEAVAAVLGDRADVTNPSTPDELLTRAIAAEHDRLTRSRDASRPIDHA